MKTAIGYIRVSTEEQVKNGNGLDIQEEQIKEYCKANNIKLLETFRDEGISGAKEIFEREGLSESLLYCYNNKPDIFLISKYDRFSRLLANQLIIESKLIKEKVELISILEPEANGTDPMRVMIRQILGAVNQFDRSSIINRVQAGKLNKAQQGKFTGGAVPYGYMLKRDVNDKNMAIISPHETKIVKMIYEKRIQEELGYQAIANYLNERKIPTVKGGLWLLTTVKKILTNDYYCGKLNYGNIKTQGKHEPIISEEIYNKAQYVNSTVKTRKRSI